MVNAVVPKPLFCVVSICKARRDWLSFWGFAGWGPSSHAMYFQKRKDARSALETARRSARRGPGHVDDKVFHAPIVLNIRAYNDKHGTAFCPKDTP